MFWRSKAYIQGVKDASKEYEEKTLETNKRIDKAKAEFDELAYEMATRYKKISPKSLKEIFVLIKDEKTKNLNSKTFKIAIITKDKNSSLAKSLKNVLDNMGHSIYLIEYNKYQDGFNKAAYDYIIYTENYNGIVFSKPLMIFDEFGCRIHLKHAQITVALDPECVHHSNMKQYCDFYEKYLKNNFKFKEESGSKDIVLERTDEKETWLERRLYKIAKKINDKSEILDNSDNAFEILPSVLSGLWYSAESIILFLSGIPEHLIEKKINQIKQVGINSSFIKDTQEQIAVIEICKFLGSLQIKRFKY